MKTNLLKKLNGGILLGIGGIMFGSMYYNEFQKENIIFREYLSRQEKLDVPTARKYAQEEVNNYNRTGRDYLDLIFPTLGIWLGAGIILTIKKEE
ncbi:MAG: hypothetical protein Q7S27_02590 [Nanoarchaeota archaeon]|nr:hypothetical protein [Nanoarchaeota archaeon]